MKRPLLTFVVVGVGLLAMTGVSQAETNVFLASEPGGGPVPVGTAATAVLNVESGGCTYKASPGKVEENDVPVGLVKFTSGTQSGAQCEESARISEVRFDAIGELRFQANGEKNPGGGLRYKVTGCGSYRINRMSGTSLVIPGFFSSISVSGTGTRLSGSCESSKTFSGAGTLLDSAVTPEGPFYVETEP